MRSSDTLRWKSHCWVLEIGKWRGAFEWGTVNEQEGPGSQKLTKIGILEVMGQVKLGKFWGTLFALELCEHVSKMPPGDSSLLMQLY